MRRTIRGFSLALAGVALLLAAQAGLAQAPASGQFGGYPMPDWMVIRHNSSAADSLEDRNGPLLIGDPLLDGPQPGRLGWFGSLDVDLLSTHVHNLLTAPVAVGPVTSQVTLPSADLNWTAAPRVEVGYRFAQAAGELLATYRSVATSGTATTPAFDPAGNPGELRSRFAMHVIDVDYAQRENSLLPWFDMKWRAGVRLANLFFDSAEVSPLLSQRISNHFFGAGPHTSLELWRPLLSLEPPGETRVRGRGLGMFGRIDGAFVAGQVQQEFAETDGAGAAAVSGFTRQTQFAQTWMLNVQLGLAWTFNESCRLSTGYTYEHWWDATFAGDSRGDVGTQGIFFHGEWRY
jgi:hypothetical protein